MLMKGPVRDFKYEKSFKVVDLRFFGGLENYQT